MTERASRKLLDPEISRVLPHLAAALESMERPYQADTKCTEMNISVGTQDNLWDRDKRALPEGSLDAGIASFHNVLIQVHLAGAPKEEAYSHWVRMFFWESGFIRAVYNNEDTLEIEGGCERPVIDWFLDKVKKYW